MKAKKFKKGDMILHMVTGYYHKCICVDKEYAIFAMSNKKGTKLTFNNLFAFSQEEGYNDEFFKYYDVV